MKLHFVTVPVHGSATAEDELNRFLSTHRVLTVDRQLIADGQRSSWAICITYTDAPTSSGAPAEKKRIDYREVLPEAEFQAFVRLRDLRKQIAEREGIPPYAVFTNEQLADMVRIPVASKADLARIDGIGPARIEKYGRLFLDALATALSPGASAVAPSPET